MKTNRWWVLTVVTCALGLMACPPTAPVCEFGDEAGCDAGAPPPDLCNSREEAISDTANCHLTLGTALSDRFISFSGDQDFYFAQMGTLKPSSLLHVTGGYGVPATPVNFAINVLREDGSSSVAREVDKHGQAVPKAVDIILPFSESNAKLIILVGDEGITLNPPFDARSPYTLKVETLDNPDPNEPNDVTPTPITVTPAGAEATGTASGVLATDDDLDKFSFTVPTAGAARRILYLHITAPKLTPSPPYRLAYRLVNAANVPVAEGQMANEFLAIDLATARLVTPGGAYTLEVFGYRSMNTVGVIPGDLRLTYKVDLRFMDDLDLLEGTTGNDTLATAHPVALTVGGSQALSGRLAYVPDPDWYVVTLQANANPTVLYARLRAGTGGGRFAPLPGPVDRQLRLTTPVSVGVTAIDRQNSCKNDQTVCPKSFDPQDVQAQQLVNSLCAAFDPPHCVMSERNEDAKWTNLRNFDSRIPVPAHAGPVTYYVIVQDDGNNFADDLNYDLTISWLADPDDAARASTPAQVTNIIESASFPDPPATGEVSGELSYGHGRVVNHDLLQAEGVRAPNDYDALSTDFDKFQFNFPAVSVPYDRTWTLQWIIDHNDGGSAPPGDLILEAAFCNGSTLADGGCGIVRNIGWIPGRVEPWYSSNFTDRAVIWDKKVVGQTTVVTAQAVGCFCMEPRGMAAGTMFASVGAVDRDSNDPIRYRVRMGLAPYPLTYAGDGGVVSCPGTGADAGCGFTGAP